MGTAMLLDDQPIEGFGELSFGFQEEVLKVEAVMKDQLSRNSWTLGVFGDWGVGKTSFMRGLRDHIGGKDGPGWPTVWFEPWKFRDEEDILIPFLNAFKKVQVCEADQTKRKRFRETLKRAGGTLALVGSDVVLRWATGGKLGTKDVRDAMKEVETELSRTVTRTDQFRERFEAAVGKLLEGSEGGRLVVFIDDLDRCLPDRALAILNSLRLHLAAPGTIFVMGVSERIVELAVETRFDKMMQVQKDRRSADEGEDDLRGEEFSGRNYLNKIVFLGWSVPTLSAATVDSYVRRAYPDLGDAVRQVYAAPALPWTPRRLKRSLNDVERRRDLDRPPSDQLRDWAVLAVLKYAWSRPPLYDWVTSFEAQRFDEAGSAYKRLRALEAYCLGDDSAREKLRQDQPSLREFGNLSGFAGLASFLAKHKMFGSG